MALEKGYVDDAGVEHPKGYARITTIILEYPEFRPPFVRAVVRVFHDHQMREGCKAPSDQCNYEFDAQNLENLRQSIYTLLKDTEREAQPDDSLIDLRGAADV